MLPPSVMTAPPRFGEKRPRSKNPASSGEATLAARKAMGLPLFPAEQNSDILDISHTASKQDRVAKRPSGHAVHGLSAENGTTVDESTAADASDSEDEVVEYDRRPYYVRVRDAARRRLDITRAEIEAAAAERKARDMAKPVQTRSNATASRSRTVSTHSPGDKQTKAMENPFHMAVQAAQIAWRNETNGKPRRQSNASIIIGK